MFIWIGVDDTDSNKGGCTTYTACIIIKELIEKGFDLVDSPWLVRLNPNVPWKTRGNGAIAIHVGYGTGKKRVVGNIDGCDVYCFSKKSSKNVDKVVIRDIVDNVVSSYSRLDDEKTNSGYVIFPEKPSNKIYKNTVLNIVGIEDTVSFLKSVNVDFRGFKNSRGLIGATAAVAWDADGDKTYEVIAYREKNKWGTKRFVDDESVIKIDESFESTFDNFDSENNHNRLVPSSPCPILFGIRGENVDDLIKAKDMVVSEKIINWMVFETNQGTDDHLQRKKIVDVQSFESVVIRGEVCSSPKTICGGHVIFSVEDKTGKIDCAAYEPTKQFRDVVRGLCVDDIVEVYGGVRQKPVTVNLEKIFIDKLVRQCVKVENPVCPNCGKHMKSVGTNQGFRCKKCGIKNNEPRFEEISRGLKSGFYEVPVCARRHLSMPLKRMK